MSIVTKLICFVLQIVSILSEFSAVFGSYLSDAAEFSVLTDYTTNSSCPTDNTAGGILGPSIGQLTATVNVDSNFYSWVGCNCSTGSDNRVYSIATDGERPVSYCYLSMSLEVSKSKSTMSIVS